jgi:hypothetical protein
MDIAEIREEVALTVKRTLGPAVHTLIEIIEKIGNALRLSKG